MSVCFWDSGAGIGRVGRRDAAYVEGLRGGLDEQAC